jgi:hypothetical protein|tara:strand:+ start:5678 stop:6451 length:774 start_codon:yes stop_codon:yes gene_type:complete
MFNLIFIDALIQIIRNNLSFCTIDQNIFLMKYLLLLAAFFQLTHLVLADARLINGSFEDDFNDNNGWTRASSVPPVRSDKEAHSGKYSLHSKLKNEFALPSEGHLIQVVNTGIIGGEKYDLTFWIKEVDFGVSYVQQYMINWISDTGQVGNIGLTNFKGGKKWTKLSVPKLTAPKDATGVRLMFRFVTGAIKGGSGEIFIDDIAIKRSDYTKEYNKLLKSNPSIAKAIKEGKISKEKVLSGIRSREEEKQADKKNKP